MKQRILFVDDEKNILDGLKRMLRGKRKHWDMTFAVGGAEALRIADSEDFDLVCSDMRMPGMDGAALLAQFHERWPRTLRFILSGHSEVESVMRSLPVAHQFLHKPCDAETLKDAITRSMALHQHLADVDYQKMIGGVGALPACPGTFQRLMAALSDHDVDMSAVAEIVESDAAIASKILQIVNSSFFGLGKPIMDIAGATRYLGVNVIKDLVLSVELFEPPADADADLCRLLEGLQVRATRTACLAQQILEVEGLHSEIAFTGALLHDVGLIVMASGAPDRLREATGEAARSKRALEVVEQEIFGMTHADIGACLLGCWGLPTPILEIVAYHHRPSDLSIDTFGALGAVHVASSLVEDGDEEIFGWACGGLDRAYLEARGMLPRLEHWRELATQAV